MHCCEPRGSYLGNGTSFMFGIPGGSHFGGPGGEDLICAIRLLLSAWPQHGQSGRAVPRPTGKNGWDMLDRGHNENPQKCS